MEHKNMFKRLLSFVVVITMLFGSFAVLAVPAAAIEGYWSEEDSGVTSEGGSYNPAHAWGYTFNIAEVDPAGAIGEANVIITTFEKYKVTTGNFQYLAHAFFAPTGEANEYAVTKVINYPGTVDGVKLKTAAKVVEAGLVTEADFANGAFVVLSASAASKPMYLEDGVTLQYANWEQKVAVWGLGKTIGAKVTLKNIDLSVAGACTNGTITVEADPNAVKDPYAGKLSIVLSDNDTILNKTVDEAIDLLTDGDWVLDAGAWGTGTANVVPFQNKNATNVSADGNIKLIWEFDETPEPYNNINFGLYADPNVMMGYPSEEDVFFSNDGVNWVGGYSSADIGYGESFVTCYASFEEGATQPGTIIGQVKLRKPQTYKFVKVEFYFPKSPFTVDNGYAAEAAKPRWEFFGLTEAFDFEYEEVSTFVPDFNPGEYYASRSGWHGTYIYNNADAYALAEFNGGDAIDSFKHVAFAPVEGVADRYEVVGVRSGNTASDDYLEFPEGGFIWVARTGANSGSVGRIAAEHLNGMNVGHVYDFVGFDIEGEFVANDATYTRVFDTTLENIALGSTYTTDIVPSTSYVDEDGITLTDGKYLTHKQLIDSPLASYKEACWFSLNCTNTDRDAAIDVALGDGESLYDLSKVVLYTGGDRIGSGIAEMKKIEVFYTVDGETYEKFGEYNYQGTPNTYLAECIIEGETVTASDIRVICYPQDGKNMVFLSELEAYGVKVEEFEYPDGYTVVDGETGKWQAAEGDFDFGYKYEVVGDNLVVDVIVNDDLVDAGAEASTGNGVATNIRLWVNYGNAKWDRLYDAYLKGGAAALFSKDAAGTVGTEGTIAFAEGVFTYTIPLAELAGGKGEFQFTICVSNTDAEGKNNACLYAFCDTFAWSAWDSANAHTIAIKVIENATNVALNKPYTTTDVYPEGDAANYPDEDGKSLTDGVAAVEDAKYSSPLWVGFHKNLDAIITVDLEKDYYLNKF
ncbi:MAG: hypothetical protein IKU30_01990, partial [Clostridia bacterium]|nr:hypothetical protein [Clostridia bacterium]